MLREKERDELILAMDGFTVLSLALQTKFDFSLDFLDGLFVQPIFM